MSLGEEAPVMVRFLGVVAVLAAAALPIQAQAGADEERYVKRVNESLDKAVQYLRQQEGGAGNWERFKLTNVLGYDGGYTALATLALLNSGIKADDPLIERALKFIRNQENSKTYVVALCTMAMSEARQKDDLLRLQRNVKWLLDAAVRRNGKIVGWSYEAKSLGGDHDASNTQYALLGLYAGKLGGVKIDDDTWRQIQDLYLSAAEDESPSVAFWRYKPGMRGGEYNGASYSMTTAGICGLLMARMGLSESEQALNAATGVAANCGRYAADSKIEKGMNFVAKHFSFDRFPEMKATFYTAYGIERLGRLSGERFIGRYDWYRAGCDWLVARQSADGSWSKNGGGIADNQLLSTCFAVLYLAKGRVPVLISKLAYGQHKMTPNGILTENLQNGAIGWNRKHSDARNIVEYSSKVLFEGTPLAWQVYDPRRGDFSTPEKMAREVGILVESPILYLNGHEAPFLTGQQKELIKQYVEKGGFLFAEACCGDERFARGFAELMAELFPENELKPVPREHPVWRSFAAISPADFPNLQSLDRGCRTVAILSTEPLAGYWEEPKYMPADRETPGKNRGEKAYKLAGNVIAYATGLEPPKQRGSQRDFTNELKRDRNPPKGYLKPIQIRIPGEPPPAPAAMRTLANALKVGAKFDVVLDAELYRDPVPLRDPELFRHKFLYMHGRKAFQFETDAVENLRATLETGGLLFADACCGSRDFDDAFRKLMTATFPAAKLETIPLDDLLYSVELNNEKIQSVKRREKADASGMPSLPPALEGVKIDGRWVVIYSKYDIGCAIEGHKSTDCLGHDRDSALKLATAAMLYSLKR
jgi:hypothetical protein